MRMHNLSNNNFSSGCCSNNLWYPKAATALLQVSAATIFIAASYITLCFRKKLHKFSSRRLCFFHFNCWRIAPCTGKWRERVRKREWVHGICLLAGLSPVACWWDILSVVAHIHAFSISLLIACVYQPLNYLANHPTHLIATLASACVCYSACKLPACVVGVRCCCACKLSQSVN